MSKEILTFGDIEIETNNFYCYKSPIYDGQTKWIYFLIEHGDFLEKYNTVWYKASADVIKEFDSQPMCNKIF